MRPPTLFFFFKIDLAIRGPLIPCKFAFLFIVSLALAKIFVARIDDTTHAVLCIDGFFTYLIFFLIQRLCLVIRTPLKFGKHGFERIIF